MKILTVTELNKYIKSLIAKDYILSNVAVEGEVINLKYTHGNYYFNLKDENASISCIIFSNFNQLPFLINEGSFIRVIGRVSIYEKMGTYSIYVDKVEEVGVGKFYEEFEKLKNKLNERGMFDAMYKKPIPEFSKKIGVVTAKNGAAIKDIEKTLRNKNPYVEIVLYPATVQGENAPESIVKGIETLDKLNLDVMIVGRGGGSKEDLWCFNDERVAYAIFNARTPIISAVGHEIDVSIADFVADLRVATPTAAGEAATYDYEELIEQINSYKDEMRDILTEKIEDIKEAIEMYKKEIMSKSPNSMVNNQREKLSTYKDKIEFIVSYKCRESRTSLNKYIGIFEELNPIKKLKSGMGYISDENGKLIRKMQTVKNGSIINIMMLDGNIKTKVLEKEVKNYEKR